MNYQMMMQIMTIMLAYEQMKKDGLDKSEKLQLFMMVLNMLSVTLKAGELITFEEQDQDLHIILKKSLRDKIGI